MDSVSHFFSGAENLLLKKNSLICELWESYFTRFRHTICFLIYGFVKKKKKTLF